MQNILLNNKHYTLRGGGNNIPLRSQVLHSKTNSKVNAKTANTITLQSHTKDSTLDSNSLDSNLNTKAMNPNALDSNFLDSIIESKRYSNLRALIFDRLTFKLKLFSLQESFKFRLFNINILNIL